MLDSVSKFDESWGARQKELLGELVVFVVHFVPVNAFSLNLNSPGRFNPNIGTHSAPKVLPLPSSSSSPSPSDSSHRDKDTSREDDEEEVTALEAVQRGLWREKVEKRTGEWLSNSGVSIAFS